MGYETYEEGNKKSFQPATVGQLDYAQHKLVELGAADGTCQLLTAAGNEVGVVVDVLQPGQPDTEVGVRLLGTVKMVQSAAIPKGSQVVADPANLGQVKAIPAPVNGTAATFRVLGRKLTFSPGAPGDIIEILDVIENITH